MRKMFSQKQIEKMIEKAQEELVLDLEEDYFDTLWEEKGNIYIDELPTLTESNVRSLMGRAFKVYDEDESDWHIFIPFYRYKNGNDIIYKYASVVGDDDYTNSYIAFKACYSSDNGLTWNVDTGGLTYQQIIDDALRQSTTLYKHVIEVYEGVEITDNVKLSIISNIATPITDTTKLTNVLNNIAGPSFMFDPTSDSFIGQILFNVNNVGTSCLHKESDGTMKYLDDYNFSFVSGKTDVVSKL